MMAHNLQRQKTISLVSAGPFHKFDPRLDLIPRLGNLSNTRLTTTCYETGPGVKGL